MNLAGVEKARSNAINELFKNQMASALQNQATGVSAGTGLSSSGSQEAQAGIGVGQFQQNAPMAAETALANILNPMRTGTNVTNSTQVSPLNQIAGIVSLLGGTTGTAGLLGQLGIKNGLQGLLGTGAGSTTGGTSPTPSDFGVNDVTPSPDDFGGFDLPTDSSQDTGGLWFDESYD